jgi:hypothetical protein
MVRKGNADTFEATKIEPANMPCEVGFSADALKGPSGTPVLEYEVELV